MIREKQPTDKIIIDLTGPRGNAFYLLGLARKLANQLGMDAQLIINEMQSKDYDNLLKVFDRNFGEFVILEY